MKKVLITGENSYIGTTFENYIKNSFSNEYQIDTLDMKNPEWKNYNFSDYDAVLHVAGIAHSDSGRISVEKQKLYHLVNTDLTIETAIKAKNEGVKQFIFMSSAIVYGNSAPMGQTKFITFSTKPSPTNAYSDSKLQAELKLMDIFSDSFKVCIIRPPMIYGKGSKGNYPVLSKISRILPIFPKVANVRSMLYIDNLCEFIRLMIKNEETGIFHPQNKEYSNTTEIVQMIADFHGKKIIVTTMFNWLLYVLRMITGKVDKAFGSFAYDQNMSVYKEEYRIVGLEKSIKETEVQDYDK